MRNFLACWIGMAFLLQAGEPLRRVSVPQNVLPLLLEQGADRVMMPQEEYDRLWERAEKIKAGDPVERLQQQLPTQVDIKAELKQDHVQLRALCEVAGLHEGLNVIELPFENVFWTAATLNGEPAELAGEPGGKVRVFIEGTGQHSLQLLGVTGLTLNQNRQQMRFRVPQVPGTQILQVHPETEITGLTTLASLGTNPEKTLRVLPVDGWVDGAFSLNRLYRPDPRQLTLRLVQTTELSATHQEVKASAQVMVNHQATRELTFELPAGLTVQKVTSHPAADWDLSSDPLRQKIHVRFPKEVLGNVTVEITALGEREALALWSPADIRLLHSTRSWKYQQLHLLDPLRLKDISYGSAKALPPFSALMEKYPEGSLYAWRPAADGKLPHIRLRKREGAVEGFATLMLQVGDFGQDLKGEVTLLPKGEGLFSSQFTLPASWYLQSVHSAEGTPLAYEKYETPRGEQLIRVDFNAMAVPQRPVAYKFSASYTPPGWLDPQTEKTISFPSFGLPGVDQLTGALAADVDEGYKLKVLNLEGLTPLDDRTRSLLKFQTADQVAGYRFESSEIGLELAMETLEPELRVEAYSFFTFGSKRLKVRYEWILENQRAAIQNFSFHLPVTLPKGVSPVGKGITFQGEVTRVPDGKGGELWTLPLVSRPGGRVQLWLESEWPVDEQTEMLLPMPGHPGIDLQSGFFSVEGIPDLRVSINHVAREVDLGELSEASYRPGSRLLGCFAYTGSPSEVKVMVEPQPLLDTPETRLRRLHLDSRLAVTGEVQTQASFTLEQPSAFLSLRLPEGAVCWGVEVNQMTVEPRKGKQGEWLIPVQGNTQVAATEVQVIYSSTVQKPGVGKRQRMPAPSLSVYADDASSEALAPIETLWVVSPPEGLKLMNSKGSALINTPLEHDLAAVETAKGLATLAGGCRTPMAWYNTLFGNALRRSVKSSKGYDYESAEAYEISDVQAELYGGVAAQSELYGGNDLLLSDSSREKYDMLNVEIPQSMNQQMEINQDFSGQADSFGTNPQGFRSLKIRLEPQFNGIGFHSLDPEPVLDISLQREEALRFLSLTVGCLVFAFGIGFCGCSRRMRTLYVMGALLLSTLPGMLPFTSAWTGVFNAVFIAGGCLVFCYMGLWILQKIWRPFKRPVIYLMAFMMGLGLRGDLSETPLPLPIPENVLVEARMPTGGKNDEAGSMYLVPRKHLEMLRELVSQVDETQDPLQTSLSWLGGVVSTRLDEESHQKWTGLIRFRTRGEGMHAIPFPVEGAEMEEVKVNAITARLRREKGGTEILVEGEGVHELSFTLRTKVKQNTSVRNVSFRLPAVPSLQVRVEAPGQGLRLEMIGEKLKRSLVSTDENRVLTVPLEQGGLVDLRWVQLDNLAEGGGGLQVASVQVMDIHLDSMTLVGDLRITPGAVPVDRIQVKIPTGWNLNSVVGDAVGGWERGEADRNQWVSIYFLREVKERAAIRLSLWKNREEGMERASVPSLPVEGVVRQTGTFVLRNTEDVELKVLQTENVKRVETPAGLPRSPGVAGKLDKRPLQSFHSYGSHSTDFKIELALSRPEQRMEARWQSLLRVAALGDVVEARCRIRLTGNKVYRMQFDVPGEMEVLRVDCAGVEEWSVDQGQLRIFAPEGLQAEAEVVIEGRFPAAETNRFLLPELKLVAADQRSGEWVVLADPSAAVKTVGNLEMKRIALAATHGWLSAPQRPYARLAFSFTDQDAAPELQVTRLTPEVTVTTFTNVRINHQVIEETLLVDAKIQRAGLREFKFRVPARFRDARVKAPLMREVIVTPLPDQPDWVEVTVVLQDEVMDQLVILLEKDRGAEKREISLQPPQVLTGRTQHVFVTVENAGRDEVRIESVSGLERLSREHKEWRSVTGMLGENVTFAYMGREGGADVELGVNRIARQQAVTAGGRIGLSRVDLQIDGEGAYLGRWTVWVDNRTEQALRASLPEGARLVGVTVAGEEVRALRDEEAGGNRLRIPLVKTPRGERDIQVELIYAGSLPSLSSLRRKGFPFPESLNLPVDLSQAQLYLPDTRRWVRFYGSMRKVEDEAQFQAGWLNYQAGLAERLAQTLKTGDVFEQARATYNINQLKSDFDKSVQGQQVQSEYYAEEKQRAGAALEKAQKELERADVNDLGKDLSDNRISFQSSL